MKPEVIKELGKTHSVRKASKVLTLDEIEQEMIELATSKTDDLVKMMVIEKKLAMLEKVANLKMHRLQLKQLEQDAIPVETKPIKVEFIDSSQQNYKTRVEQMEELVENQLGMQSPKS